MKIKITRENLEKLVKEELHLQRSRKLNEVSAVSPEIVRDAEALVDTIMLVVIDNSIVDEVDPKVEKSLREQMLDKLIVYANKLASDFVGYLGSAQ